MTDRDKQDQTETKIVRQTFSEFLENSPPNQVVHVSDLVTLYASYEKRINAPELRLHCSYESCSGVRFFRSLELPINRKALDQDTLNYLYIRYQCDNCKNTQKVYSLAVIVDSNERDQGVCFKLGEFPAYGPPVPSRLIKL